jgi:hypothetical protein
MALASASARAITFIAGPKIRLALVMAVKRMPRSSAVFMDYIHLMSKNLNFKGLFSGGLFCGGLFSGAATLPFLPIGQEKAAMVL